MDGDIKLDKDMSKENSNTINANKTATNSTINTNKITGGNK